MWKTLAAIFVLMIPAIADAAVTTWSENSTVKVLEDAAPGAAKVLKLAGARREVAAGQIVIRADANLADVTVRASNLSDAGTIPSGNIKLWREHYIKAGAKNWPDPLSPLATLALKKNVAQPVFVEIEIPHDSSPGLYRGELNILKGNEQLATMSIELTVYDFELPATPALRTAFGNNDEPIRAFEKPADEEQFQRLRKAYYEILLAHRVSPFFIPADLNKPNESDAFLADPRLTSFNIPYLDDDQALKKLCDRLRAGGWFKKGYFYVVDEPATQDAYDRLGKVAERLKRVVGPDYKLVVPYNGNPQFKSDKDVFGWMAGKVTIWCYITSLHWYRTDQLDAHRARGEEIWNYVAWVPAPPFANFQIQQPGIQNRILFWQEWKYQTTGVLYWSSNWWANNEGGTTNPWTDMATVKWASRDVFGDGSLLYPGKKIGHDAPLPSLRLKIIRQGLVDYDYMALAEKKGGRAAVDAIVNEQVKDWQTYQQDPAKLDEARAKLAALIAK